MWFMSKEWFPRQQCLEALGAAEAPDMWRGGRLGLVLSVHLGVQGSAGSVLVTNPISSPTGKAAASQILPRGPDRKDLLDLSGPE